MIAPSASRAPCSASATVRAGRPTSGPPHAAERIEAGNAGLAMILNTISARPPPPAVARYHRTSMAPSSPSRKIAANRRGKRNGWKGVTSVFRDRTITPSDNSA